MDPQIRLLLESAATGEAAKMFLRSDLGGYLIDRATEEIEDATADLIDVAPSDALAIAALQTRIKVARQAITWLSEAIQEGDNAQKQLHEDS